MAKPGTSCKQKPFDMCNAECCAVKTALKIRMMKRKIERMLREELAKPIPKIIPSPQTLIHPYEYVKYVADLIVARTTIKPEFGLVCGTNFSKLAKLIENPILITYADIPQFPQCNSPGHAGNLILGTLRGATIIVMQGRFHCYDGNQPASCAMPMRVMKLCGVEYVILTGKSNGINLKYNVGDIMLITDHINLMSLMGNSPLCGPHDKRFGTPRVDMKHAYDSVLLQKAFDLGREIGYHKYIHRGVYGCVGGPGHETITEQKFFRQIGIDVVGKSITNEVTVARQCGMKVFALTYIYQHALERTHVDAKNFEDAYRLCCELITRLIYTIKNNLLFNAHPYEAPSDAYVAGWHKQYIPLI